MKRKFLSGIFSFFILFSLVLFSTTTRQEVGGQIQNSFGSEVAFPSLTFSQPVGIYGARDGTNRLFVVEQKGIIRVFNNSQNIAVAEIFLDIRDRVLFSGEQGLLGLAFHPKYRENGLFFVDYVAANPTRTVIARYSVTSNNLNLADKNSEIIVFEITQPFANHKGGQIAFGPDGFLYIGMGDGGSEGDPLGNGQNCSSMLGKILRIDVNRQSQNRSYAVPIDNPFTGNALGYHEEIYAYGFRNPWRFSFDNVTGKLWVGDVGQDRLEEIDLVEKGNNYGWNIMEGNFCYNPSNGCNITGLELPVYEYNHSLGNAIIGGYVYRGPSLSSLAGSYVYGDYGSGKIWGLNGSGMNLLLVDSDLVLSSFGVDDNNELYFCAFNGKVYNLSMGVVPEFSPVTMVVFLVTTTALVFLFFRKRRVSLRIHSFGL